MHSRARFRATTALLASASCFPQRKALTAALLRAMLPLWPPCMRVFTCAAPSARRVAACFCGRACFGACFLPGAQVIDNGLDLLMIKPLERM